MSDRRSNISGTDECCENCKYSVELRSVPPDPPLDGLACVMWLTLYQEPRVDQTQPWDMCEMWTARGAA